MAQHRPADILVALTALCAGLLACGFALAAGRTDPFQQPFPDQSGALRTYTTNGSIDLTNPFFGQLGTNGRSCATCHVAQDGWSITPRDIQHRFAASAGTDPIFRLVDGSTTPDADVSTVDARKQAYSLLLARGLLRFQLSIPPDAEFTLVHVDDPYGPADAQRMLDCQCLSLFRRPLPTANLRFLTAVMSDGRETPHPITTTNSRDLGSLEADLLHQALDTTVTHMKPVNPPSAKVLRQIVAFETGIYTTQVSDNHAGSLRARGARGGPRTLSRQAFAVGSNKLVQHGKPPGAKIVPARPAFTLFKAWTHLPSSGKHAAARRLVARGEALFNKKTFLISGVAGLNDALGQPSFEGTCSSCHDAPNVGSSTLPTPMNVGVSDPRGHGLETSGLPVYTLQDKASGETVRTTDPGRAIVTGKWSDIGRFEVPVLRGLAARPPYFHNGSAASLKAVVAFYDRRFHMNLSKQEKAALIAFLRSL